MTIYEETFGRFSPFSIGFDRLFQQLQAQSVVNQQNYPPYNIVKVDDENFVIELAIAGFDKKEVNVELEKNVLKIEGKSKDDDKDFIHKGLASRSSARVRKKPSSGLIRWVTALKSLLREGRVY